jgi:glycosyltransferase involved in cell wall biosynthesis
LWFDKRLAQQTSMLIGNSQAVIDFYREVGVSADRLRVIRNGINPPLPACRGRAEILDELKIPPTARVVGYVGRLAPQKRVQDLLWAFALLRNCADQETYFVVVGDGPERADDERFAERVGYNNFIRFTGHRADVRDLMGAFDVFWLASEYEGQSNSLMEAMSLGLPVVVSDIPANRELVEHEVTGLIVPMGDRPAFTHCAWKLLQQPELAQKLGKAAAARMLNEFSVDRMIADHADVYRQVASSATASDIA